MSHRENDGELTGFSYSRKFRAVSACASAKTDKPSTSGASLFFFLSLSTSPPPPWAHMADGVGCSVFQIWRPSAAQGLRHAHSVYITQKKKKMCIETYVPKVKVSPGLRRTLKSRVEDWRKQRNKGEI